MTDPLRTTRIQAYLHETFSQEDAILKHIKERSREALLPKIEIPSTLGKFLSLLVTLQHANRVLEVGTLAGYSTVWLARALPLSGKIISLECHPKHAELAREHLTLANLTQQVEIREGQAQAILQKMIENQEDPFDLIFLDADKEHALVYLEQAILLSRPGTLILTDNLIPKGDQIGKPENLEAIEVYRFNAVLAAHPKLESVLLPTLVDQGRVDALSLSRVK